jgi:hypothetical protein
MTQSIPEMVVSFLGVALLTGLMTAWVATLVGACSF